MTPFVLVHGAWHGSWCWKRVRTSLQAKGHDVFTPTLTGVAERLHLLTPDVTLETHILDVVNLIRWEELSDIVNRQCTAQPIETVQQRIKLGSGIKTINNVTFILATGFVEGSPFPPFYEKAKAKGWKTRTIACGHDVMLDRPEELTSLLLSAVQTSQAARAGS